MFKANEAVYVNIVVAGARIAVPGIATTDEYTADRQNRFGGTVPTQYVEVITYHDVPADASRSGAARTYWKAQRQSAAFMSYRADPVPELDDLTAPELLAKVAESLEAIQQQTAKARSAAAEAAVKPKADFNAVQQPLLPTS